MLFGLLALSLGQAPSIELRLTTQPGPATCPDTQALKASVSKELGYSPFTPASDTVYQVTATCVEAGCEGSLLISRPSEEPRSRPFVSGPGECSELFESISSAMAQAIAYEADVGRRLSTVDAPESLPLVPTGKEPPIAPIPVTTNLTFRTTLFGGASAGLSLGVTPVIGGSLGVGWRQFSLAVEGRLDLNQTVLVRGSSIQSSVIVATLAPCVHLWGFGACVLVSTAAVRVRGDLETGATDSAAIFLLGPRLTYEWMFTKNVGLHAHASLQGAFSSLSVRVSDELVWSTSRVTGDFVAGVIVVF